jgi:hypothetical protein
MVWIRIGIKKSGESLTFKERNSSLKKIFSTKERSELANKHNDVMTYETISEKQIIIQIKKFLKGKIRPKIQLHSTSFFRL